MRRLTNKQQHFVSEYVENRGNATQDALVSYKTSYPSVRVIGSENLTKPNIRREIDFLMHKADLRVEDALQTIRDAVLTAPLPRVYPCYLIGKYVSGQPTGG